MRDRDDVLTNKTDDVQAEVQQTLAALKRGAQLAGFLTTDPGVQIALIRVYGQLSLGVALHKGIAAIERLTDHVRAVRRGGLS